MDDAKNRLLQECADYLNRTGGSAYIYDLASRCYREIEYLGKPVVDDERIRQLRGFIREAKDCNWEDLDFCLWELQESRKQKRRVGSAQADEWAEIPY
jgi:hypothetical protein